MSEAPTVVVTACLFTDGSAVYLRANDTWASSVQEAALFGWAEGEEQLERRASDVLPLVFATAIIEAELGEDGVIELFGRSCATQGSRQSRG